MSSTPDIRLLDLNELPQVHDLYSRAFGTEATERWKKRFDWQFIQHPDAEQQPSKLFVAERNGRLVGFLGSFPVRLWIGGTTYVGLCGCDLLVVDPPDVGSKVLPVWPTIGQRLIQAFLEHAGPLGASLQYTPANRRLHERLGYRLVDAQPVYLRPLRLKPLVGAVLERRPLVGSFANAFAPLAAPLLGAVNLWTLPRRHRGISIEEVTSPGPEFDSLWNIAAPSFPATFVRDRRFVQWRFFDESSHRYVVLLARNSDGDPVGYVAGTIATRRGVRCGMILDMIVTPTGSMAIPPLLGALTQRLRDLENIAAMMCMGGLPNIRRKLERHLYMRPAGLASPALLLWRGDPELESTVYDAESWHLMHADGDDALGL